MICYGTFGLPFISELSVKRINQVNEPGFKKQDFLKNPRNISYILLTLIYKMVIRLFKIVYSS